eukprot:2805053-Pleurochrysis_carterae.AAC.1
MQGCRINTSTDASNLHPQMHVLISAAAQIGSPSHLSVTPPSVRRPFKPFNWRPSVGLVGSFERGRFARSSAMSERAAVAGASFDRSTRNVRCLPDGRCPTSFPAPCALAASFNMENVRKMASIIGSEMRSYFHAGEHNSLDTWSPTININRDPRRAKPPTADRRLLEEARRHSGRVSGSVDASKTATYNGVATHKVVRSSSAKAWLTQDVCMRRNSPRKAAQNAHGVARCRGLWGRNVESPSEDPFLSGSFGVAYTTGLQSERSGNGHEGSGKGSVRQATVTLKHWVAYSVENYGNVTRHTFNVRHRCTRLLHA